MSPRNPPLVSIVIPCRNEERYLARCLDSILASEYASDRLEVLVVDGRSDDRTPAILAGYAARHPRIRVLENARRTAPAALNAGIRAARGDIILRMDAHVVYPPPYIPRLVAALEETGADNVGGLIVTLPADESAVARAIAVGLSHPLGVGTSYFRIGSRTRRWVDTVPFGCYRRDVFQRIGMFDEELIRNQDDEFNFRLIRQGGRVLLVPDVVAYYYARGSLRHLARMYYQYGRFKPLVARKVGRIMTVRQLVPALFVAALAAAATLSLWLPPARLVLGGIVGAYAALLLGGAAHGTVRHGVGCGLLLAAVFPVLHVGYGLGFLRGLLPGHRRLSGRPDHVAVPLSR
ncbi:MAG: glycosyltransferase family 2 protein [Gemmatimonadetes bacterium]|nr:glycosyltransferase family 2 protein [Gemmatimonadota bacterium]